MVRNGFLLGFKINIKVLYEVIYMEKMTCEEFYKVLEDIKNKPSLYIGTKSLIRLKHFLDGIFYTLCYLNGQKECPNFLEGFQEWIQIRFDITSTQHWSDIINFHSSNDVNAFDLFFELLNEFLNLDKKVRNYDNILEKQEKWMELKSEYWQEYHKIYSQISSSEGDRYSEFGGTNMQYGLLLFDLDGTLLRDDKTISGNTIDILNRCRKKGIIIGISTSRSKNNTLLYLKDLNPEIVITSGGALVHFHDEIIYAAKFTIEETNNLIETTRYLCGKSCEITVDTLNEHYWNYKIDPQKLDSSWGDSIYSDFREFNLEALKVCVEIHDPHLAVKLKNAFPEYDCIRFSGGDWYKFTKKNATKENAIIYLCDYCNISKESIIAFGDDYSDIGMLKVCGLGIAMGNAIEDVKVIADEVIGTNEDDGIADYLMKKFKI